ncbi:restriction endonuclease subunit S [Paraclostridium bifermentans]
MDMSKKLPEGWRRLSLSELGKIYTGNTPPTKKEEFYISNDVMFIKPDDFIQGKINIIGKSKAYLSKVGAEKGRFIPKGSVLITCIGILGKVGIIDEDCCFNQQINAIVPNLNIVIPKYVAYYIMNNKHILESMAGGAVVPMINKTQFSSIKIDLPPLEEQERIVSILEKAENAIEKRVESIKLFDELIKSRFIDMFDKGNYPIVKAEDVCEYITKGTTPKGNEIFEEYADGLIPYLKVYNLSFDGTMLFNEKPQYVKSEIHNGFLARSKVYPNDILMNIVGPPLGKFSIVPDTFKEWNINQAMAIFRATDKIKPIFLLHALKQPNVLRPFIDSAVGVRQQNLSLLQCRNLEIPLPPIELQNKFVEFVKQVDKLKFEMENSLKELENNFNSLMQKAFNGEL